MVFSFGEITKDVSGVLESLKPWIRDKIASHTIFTLPSGSSVKLQPLTSKVFGI